MPTKHHHAHVRTIHKADEDADIRESMRLSEEAGLEAEAKAQEAKAQEIAKPIRDPNCIDKHQSNCECTDRSPLQQSS